MEREGGDAPIVPRMHASTHQVEEEIRVLRAMGCSFEPQQAQQQHGGNNMATSAPASAAAGWVRAPGLPAWNDCFRCLFYDNCWGPRDASFCMPSLKRCVVTHATRGSSMTHARFNSLDRDSLIAPVARSFLRRGIYVYQVGAECAAPSHYSILNETF